LGKKPEWFARGNQRLREAIAAVDDARLDEPILEGMRSIYTTLHGAVQHDLYHAGQIAILKKASTEKPYERVSES
jgi:hypothetical protein